MLERPYDWYVYQQETGEYSSFNCMPACIEMSMLYQGLTNPPSTETLRNEYPLDGQAWHDILAEEVMTDYNLDFISSYDVDISSMLNYLDNGNVLYIMYNQYETEVGHAVIIKGYKKSDDTVNFIISDPDYNLEGPFGYLEYTVDAKDMIGYIRRHVPRYFVIKG